MGGVRWNGYLLADISLWLAFESVFTAAKNVEQIVDRNLT